jgi:hypothetical protein
MICLENKYCFKPSLLEFLGARQIDKLRHVDPKLLGNYQSSFFPNRRRRRVRISPNI